MSYLIELPEELITVIVHNLSDDKQSLLKLCLVGNHALLAIAQPLTWKEVTFHVDLNDWLSSHHIVVFTTDQRRARSVVSAKIRFSGIYDYHHPIIKLLQECLKRLINLNHAYLGFFEASVADTDDDNSSFLDIVLQSIPWVKSIHVEGYAAREEEHMFPMELHQLKCLVANYCSPNVAEAWSSAQNKLEVIELCGGYGENYYWKNIRNHNSTHSFVAYDGETMGTGYLLNEDLLHAGYFNHLRRFHVVSELEDRDSCLDIDHFIEFFTLCPNTLTALEEIIFELPFTVAEYEIILDGVAVPRLKRLKITLEDDPLFSIEAIFAQSSLTRWAKLASLEEFWLPMEGITRDQIEMIKPGLSNLKSLKCLYFKESREYTDVDALLAAFTTGHRTNLLRLEVISWDNHSRVGILRDQKGKVKSVSKQEYRKPNWQTFALAP